MTLLQKITVGAFIAYAIWEIAIAIWARTLPPNDPIIRADLILIIPILAFLLLASVIQYFWHKHHHKVEAPKASDTTESKSE